MHLSVQQPCARAVSIRFRKGTTVGKKGLMEQEPVCLAWWWIIIISPQPYLWLPTCLVSELQNPSYVSPILEGAQQPGLSLFWYQSYFLPEQRLRFSMGCSIWALVTCLGSVRDKHRSGGKTPALGKMLWAVVLQHGASCSASPEDCKELGVQDCSCRAPKYPVPGAFPTRGFDLETHQDGATCSAAICVMRF